MTQSLSEQVQFTECDRGRTLFTQPLAIAFGSEISKGRLPFHPIPCGPTLIGHVTSGTTYMTVSSPVSNQFTVIHLPTYQFHGGTYTRLLPHGTS